MNEIHREKLNRLLHERRDRIKSIRHFDEFYERFIFNVLRPILDEINMQLQEMTDDHLKLFMNDPYEEKESRYYSMVQFLLGGHRRREFYLDNTKNFPTITFEGNELNGKILISQKFSNKDKFEKVYETDARLVDDNRISEILIDFIDKVYRA